MPRELIITEPEDKAARISMILWGESGVGKTTLAATLPGRKLFLMLDPDGETAIRQMPDWRIADVSGWEPLDIAKAGRSIDPFSLENKLDDIDSVIVDSLSKFSE